MHLYSYVKYCTFRRYRILKFPLPPMSCTYSTDSKPYFFQRAFPMKKSSARNPENAIKPPSLSMACFLTSHDIPLAQFSPFMLASMYTRECWVPKYTCREHAHAYTQY